MALIFWIGAVWGAIADRRYMRAGGKKPSKLEVILWSAPAILFAAFSLFMMFTNHQNVDWDGLAYALGQMVATTFPAYLCIYELRRWFTRYRYPASSGLKTPNSVVR